MALQKYQFIADRLSSDQRLDQFLFNIMAKGSKSNASTPALQPLSKGKIRKLIIAGAVYLNGKRIRIASKNILAKAKVEVYIDHEKLDAGMPSTSRYILTADNIIFEDEFLIVINKPPGLPCVATLDDARDNLTMLLKEFLKERDHVIEPYIGIHHRLDADTSGLMLFTKSESANQSIADQFQGHLIQKIYYALCKKHIVHVPDTWEIKNTLARISKKKNKYHSIPDGDGQSQLAHTEFKLIKSNDHFSLIEAKPITGRTHQIRVHLSEYGLPVEGDRIYSPDKGASYKRLLLHAHRLTISHPMTRKELMLEAPVPVDFRSPDFW